MGADLSAVASAGAAVGIQQLASAIPIFQIPLVLGPLASGLIFGPRRPLIPPGPILVPPSPTAGRDGSFRRRRFLDNVISIPRPGGGRQPFNLATLPGSGLSRLAGFTRTRAAATAAASAPTTSFGGRTFRSDREGSDGVQSDSGAGSR